MLLRSNNGKRLLDTVFRTSGSEVMGHSDMLLSACTKRRLSVRGKIKTVFVTAFVYFFTIVALCFRFVNTFFEKTESNI